MAPLFVLRKSKVVLLVALCAILAWRIWALSAPKPIPDFVKSVRVEHGPSSRVRVVYARHPIRATINDPRAVFYVRARSSQEVCIGLVLAEYETSSTALMFKRAGKTKDIPISYFKFAVPCERVEIRVLRVAQQLLQQEPLNKQAFQNLPMSEHLKLMLKLRFCETSLSVEVLPGGYRARPLYGGAAVEIDARPILIKETGIIDIPVLRSF